MRVSCSRLIWAPRSWSNRILVLGLLCVHPDFQRRGIGKGLVQWGLRQAAHLGLTVHLEASPEGFPLYRSLGFNVVETLVVEADQWDGGFERQYVVMLRERKSEVLEKVQR